MPKVRDLTDKQRLFVDYYLLCMNATEAAKQAGYSEKTAYKIGAENLKKPQIAARIEKRREEVEELCQVSKIKNLKQLAMTAELGMKLEPVRDMFGRVVMIELDDEEEPGKKYKAVAVRHDPKAVVAAVAEINKMQGYHAPTKIEDVGNNPFAALVTKLFGEESA